MANRTDTAIKLLHRIRELGANLDLTGESERFRIINEGRLPREARPMIADYARELATLLRHELEDNGEAFAERAAIIEFDGRTPREWAEQFADILIRRRPVGVSELDWSHFITRCGQIIDENPVGAA